MRRFVVLLLLPSLLTGGCTSTLWDNTDWECFPANENNLHVYDAAAKKDYLVVYNEWSERKKKIRPRAYFLYQNQERMASQKRPEFVSVLLTNGLPVVPVVRTLDGITNVPAGTFVVSTNITSFIIYSNQMPVINANLPWYSDAMGSRERTLFVPATVVVDGVVVVVVVVVILGVVYLYLWSQSRAGWPAD